MEAGRSRQLDQWHIVLVGAEGGVTTKDFRVLFPPVDLRLSSPEDAVGPAASIISMWLDCYNLRILTQLVEKMLEVCPACHLLTPLLPVVITHIVVLNLKARAVQHHLLGEVERAQLRYFAEIFCEPLYVWSTLGQSFVGRYQGGVV